MTSKQIGIGVAVVAALAIVGLFFVPHFINSLSGGSAALNSMETTGGTGTGATTPEPTSLQVTDTVVGTGAEAKAGSTVTVQYTGKLTNGTVFDSSIPRGEPFTFVLGKGEVIPGWEQGIAGMKVGGKRTLVIPSSLAYGSRPIQGRDQAGNVVDVIPANSTLLFDVELVGVK